MRHIRRSLNLSLVLLGGALLLAACGGGGEDVPTSTPVVEITAAASVTPNLTASPTTDSPFPTFTPLPSAMPFIGEPPGATGVDEGPAPGGRGTLVAVGTVDPELPAGFDQIILVRQGGPMNEAGQTIDETIIINRDGTMSRNGVAGMASRAGLENINTKLDAINFFAAQSNFIGPVTAAGEQPYMYQLFVRKGYAERLITAQDSMMPAEIEAIVVAVLAEGFTLRVSPTTSP